MAALMWVMLAVVALEDPAPLLDKRLHNGRVSFGLCFDNDTEEKLSHVLNAREGVDVLRQVGAGKAPDRALQHLLLGCLLWRDGSKDEPARETALAHLRESTTLAGDNLLVTNALGQLAVQLGRIPVETRTAALLNAKPPARALYWRGLAYALSEPKDLKTARDLLSQSVSLGKDVDAQRVLAGVLHDQGEDDAALKLLETLPVGAHSPASRLLWGELLLKGQPARAAQVLGQLRAELETEKAERRKDRRPYHERADLRDTGCALGRAQVALGELDAADASFERDKCAMDQARAFLTRGNLWEAMILLDARATRMEDRILLLDVLQRLGFTAARQQRLGALHKSCAKRPDKACSALPPLPVDAASDGTGWDPALLAQLEARMGAMPVNPLTETPLEAAQPAEDLKPLAKPPTRAGMTVVDAVTGKAGDAVLALSRDVHPMGEVGRGGWWLWLRPAGKKEFDAPLWLGVADRFPYARSDDARVLGVTATHVTLRLLRAPLDPASVTYPPVKLRTREEPVRVKVTVDLARLRADADRDGLTDVLEHKLLTRPDAADSDGDSMPDASDPLPLQAGAAAAQPVAQVLAAVLQHLQGQKIAAVVEPMDRSGAPTPTQGQPGRVTFVASDVPLSLLPPAQGQLVVLPGAVLERYRAVFGPTEPLVLGPVLLRADGKEAFLHYSGGFYWGSLRVTQNAEGAWVVTRVSHFIS